MTRYTDKDRDSWNDDERKRCEECGLEPDQCNCVKDNDDIL